MLVAVDLGDLAVAALDHQRFHLVVGSPVDELRVRPVVGLLLRFDPLPGDPEDDPEDENESEIEEAGAGDANHLGKELLELVARF